MLNRLVASVHERPVVGDDFLTHGYREDWGHVDVGFVSNSDPDSGDQQPAHVQTRNA